MNELMENERTGRRLPCEDIQALLLEYMTRELGSARADLVREHLRRCEKCQAAAVETERTLAFLRGAAHDRAGLPVRLSDERRKRIIRSIMHPIITWIDRHHGLVSGLVAVLVLVGLMLWLRQVRIWRTETYDGIPVKVDGHAAEYDAVSPAGAASRPPPAPLP